MTFFGRLRARIGNECEWDRNPGLYRRLHPDTDAGVVQRGFCERLASHPRQVLADNGLEIPRNTVVRIVRSSDAEPDLQAQIEMWQQGAVTGKYILHVPYLPQMDVSDLSDEELGDLAGGAAGCCCSPCCCQSE